MTRTNPFYPSSRKTASVSSGMKAKKFRFGGISLPTKRQEENTPGVSPRELHKFAIGKVGQGQI
ncbi:hypothetical protein A2154_04750 [Candidatus Gottesmanbacteria bacterium RBG_16_43_7]|uniref:Uncharacterized protein n=1 Tax=Candidatus Gottesmanbacteria bacterium RBG_16_43_7 TaxID=1798373 RepID=A0A1F5Z7V8_9BACT|nr:MAG: hypothetical protein A2154_04750 [Candidatus Gottesmanbacteria bacterium RBG_16_43_7]